MLTSSPIYNDKFCNLRLAEMIWAVGLCLEFLLQMAKHVHGRSFQIRTEMESSLEIAFVCRHNFVTLPTCGEESALVDGLSLLSVSFFNQL